MDVASFPPPAASEPPSKARDYPGRFREVLSDPLNLLIDRVPGAGTCADGKVVLHNGNLAFVEGRHAYYGTFSQLLVLNRGVHEPLEEYLFQELLAGLRQAPTMLELGAYWGHYSMWLKRERPEARVTLVEPDSRSIESGRRHFALNGFEGEFIQAKVASGEFEVDAFMRERGLERLDILHSDIQGFELEMLDGAAAALERKAFDYIFISTHSDRLHAKVAKRLKAAGYRVEASSDFATQTTSFDGLVFASHPGVGAVAEGLTPLGREELALADPETLVAYVVGVMKRRMRRRASCTATAAG